MKNINRPTVWFRYVDDTFTLFKNKSDTLSFLHYLNGRHNNIKFMINVITKHVSRVTILKDKFKC